MTKQATSGKSFNKSCLYYSAIYFLLILFLLLSYDLDTLKLIVTKKTCH